MKKIIKTFTLAFMFSSQVFATEKTRVSYEEFTVRDYSLEVKTFGKARDINSVEIVAPANKEILLIPDVGEKVNKGDLIVKLELDNLRESLEAARLKVEELSILVDSKERLKEKDLISKHEILKAKRELMEAKSNLKSLEEELNNREIYSPVSGEVVVVNKNQGEHTGGGVLLEISDLTNIVKTEVLARHSSELLEGSRARFIGVDGETYEGLISFISPKVNKNNTIDLEIKVNSSLKPHLSGDVFLSLSPRSVLKIPSSSLVIGEKGKLFVFESDNGIAIEHPVNVISFVDDDVLIEPIKKRLNIITMGQYYLKNGQEIEIKQ